MKIKYYKTYNGYVMFHQYIDSNSPRIVEITDDYITITEEDVDMYGDSYRIKQKYGLKFDVAVNMLIDGLKKQSASIEQKITELKSLKDVE